MLDQPLDGASPPDGNLPVEFTFENRFVRTIRKDGEPWFVAADVCAVLGLENPTSRRAAR